MNIFVLDNDPAVAAINMVDIHCSKMVLEASQVVSNCFSSDQLASADCPRTQLGKPRKHSYPHHPCCKWAQQSQANMRWIINHAIAADQERMWRKDSQIPHFSLQFIKWCADNIQQSNAPDIGLTPFVLAMPEEFKNADPVRAYRDYYKFGKSHLHKWTKRGKPAWL